MPHASHVILGAGPAGVQLGLHFAARGLDFVILDRADVPGSFFKEYPRHGKLLSINKVYTGYEDRESRLRFDWNSILVEEEELQFTRYSKRYFPDSSLVADYLADVVKAHPLPIQFGTEVKRVSRRGGGALGLKYGPGFALETANGATWTCDRLIVATGMYKENLPDVDGIEHCETYATMPIDPDNFEDQRVLIVGKGNSAFETADNLIETTRKIQVVGPHFLKLAWATHFVGHLRAVNNNFLDTYQLKAQNNILDGELRTVRKNEDGSLTGDIWFESRQMSISFNYDRVLLCTGFRFDPDIFSEEVMPALTPCGRLPLQTSEWESTNVPGIFFAGTLMQQRDFKKTMSSFIHGFRHNVECLDQVLELKDGAQAWRKSFNLAATPCELAAIAIHRLSTASTIALQPGYLGDLIGFKGTSASWMRDMPLDFAKDHLQDKFDETVVITLEYKHSEEYMDPFAMPRGVGVKEDYYLHPILRRFVDGTCVQKAFLPDDLDNDWRNEAEHHRKLVAFFESFLKSTSACSSCTTACSYDSHLLLMEGDSA